MSIRVMVVGGGGREHALAWKLAQSPRTAALYCAPGSPGTETLAESVPVPANDVEGVVAAAERLRIDLVVVGPEEPLALGLADQLIAAGIPVCGPTAAAARIETSKAWAKELMDAAGVPNAHAVVVTELDAGKAALASFALPVVVKADGLAAGKGVVVATTEEEAIRALTSLMQDRALGAAGQKVVIEEFLVGQEVSIFALTDGKTILTLTPACDYKRVFDGDDGPNTGGMGSYAPVPAVDDALLASIRADILEPTVQAMAVEGAPMRGILYAGLMLTDHGPMVIEFNARFGDPETQVVLPLLDGDLTALLAAVATGTLADVTPPPAATGAAVAVVLASGGYPGPYQTGFPITGLDRATDDTLVFHAGTRRDEHGRVVTAGGRVLAVVGRGADLGAARERAYEAASAISFDSAHYRRDIAAREIMTQSRLRSGRSET